MATAFFDISWEGPVLDKKTYRITDNTPKSKLTQCYPAVGSISQQCVQNML